MRQFPFSVPRREFLALAGGVGAGAFSAGCGTAAGRDGVPATTIRYQGWAGTVTPAELAEDLGLKREGLDSGEAAEVERIALPPVNTEQALRKGRIEVAVLGDLMRDKALERGGIRPLFDDHRLLGTFSAGTYVMADRFLDRHPRVARAFVTGVARALEWARRTPREQVVARMVRIVERRDRSEDTAPLRYWQSYGVAGTGGRIAPRELATWARWLERRGDIKADRVRIEDIYTNAYNRYPRSRGR
ncbi:hypothetical protein GCM10009801_42640 [Streptomyces albiaxialis]|uniref:ABC transporter substrate-binding protein n=1 Tax=Streptomyces albiaxialis TaxID=329523 RepID=A0ABN2W390_9ACTN